MERFVILIDGKRFQGDLDGDGLDKATRYAIGEAMSTRAWLRDYAGVQADILAVID